ncbi:NAD(P)H-dependent oxidoreductase [Paenibacillus sp. N1-5-1-14]|uniref:NADPH-dependent FMN reductase n=1 Tax=Paenibacillus radicibacter TaxID=2972488 RepID=UPI0021593263|nr:NADPH-dependent FMN reductase [Paenibacillus radicibacter]MCR8642910.1 NAD(P)H-dependent oxidoreductase [Paenibacillus radicibacter]
MGQLKIGIILGSTRQGRVSPQVGDYVKQIADQRGDASYEIVDIAEYQLPFLGEGTGEEPGLTAWPARLATLDGFVFIVQEYNHSITGALKNALDLARVEWNHKAAGIVSYGSTGGARAAEHLRGILGELLVADVRAHPTFSSFTDFENFSTFKPAELHIAKVNAMLDEVVKWSIALKTIR